MYGHCQQLWPRGVGKRVGAMNYFVKSREVGHNILKVNGCAAKCVLDIPADTSNV